jgi:hypothetical protein
VPAFRVHRVGLSKIYSQWPLTFLLFRVVTWKYLKVWQQV